jgi:hypothetical protein
LKKDYNLIESVHNLRLPFVPCRTFKNEKFGGWVAENYRAFTMISPFGSLLAVFPTTTLLLVLLCSHLPVNFVLNGPSRKIQLG